jgi:hypothetical protein
MTRTIPNAVAVREASTVRVRRLTAALVAAGVGLAALFTALAAGATHVRKVTPRARAASTPAAPVSAPVPPLVAVHAPASSTPPPPPAPAPAPASSAPPVVVSGGS